MDRQEKATNAKVKNTLNFIKMAAGQQNFSKSKGKK